MIKINGSTNVAGYHHNPQTNEMDVQFRSGKVYRYYDVPADLAHGIAKAHSAGGYLNQHIKPKRDFTEVNPKSVERVS